MITVEIITQRFTTTNHEEAVTALRRIFGVSVQEFHLDANGETVFQGFIVRLKEKGITNPAASEAGA